MGVYGIQKIIVFCDYFGDSNYKIRAQIFIDGNEALINVFENEIKKETFRRPEDFSRRFEAFKSAKGQYYNCGADATIRITDSPDVRMAESKLSDGGISNTGTSNEQSARDNAKGIIKTFTNPQGEVYGFVTGAVGQDERYIDEEVISPFR